MSITLALLLAALSPAAAQDNHCADPHAPAVLDITRVLAQHISPGPAPGDYADLSPEALQARVDTLNDRARFIAPYAASYARLMDKVAGHNHSTFSRMADAATLNSPWSKYQNNPFAEYMPKDWSDISYSQLKVLQEIAREVTEQLREDLRAGTVSAPLDPGVLALGATSESAVAAMRLDQLLQQNEIPQSFRGHSPASVSDVRGLQDLTRGASPDARSQPAAFDVVSHHLRDTEDGAQTMWRWRERGTLPEAVKRKGLPQTLPNAATVAEELDALTREKWSLDAALSAAGLPAAETPELDAALQQLQQLDDLIAEIGLTLQERLSGFPTTYGVVLEDGKQVVGEVPKDTWRPAPVTGPGSRGYETHTLDGRLTFFPASPIAPDAPDLSGDQLDELVRVKDALELMEGNRSGLTPADVSMSPWLRQELGLGEPPALERFAENQRGLFLMEDGQIVLNKEVKRYRPSDWIRDRPAAIDLAALVPAEERQDYLLSIKSMTFKRSLGERSFTELTEEFDNTWLNRTVEVVDFPGWIFKGKDSDRWIGRRSETNLNRSEYISEQVDTLDDAVTTDAIYGRHQAAMDQLRAIHGLNNAHSSANDRYKELAQQTEMETGLFLATLPLSAMGLAEGGVAAVSKLRRGARFIDDGARLLDDGARLVDNLGAGADDLARVADDLDGVVDDFAHLDEAGFLHRSTALEDDFVRQYRGVYPDTELDELAIRGRFRDHHRFDDVGKLRQLQGREAVVQRQLDGSVLRDSDLFRADLKARGISDERIAWMKSKQAPLSFESPEQYQKFQSELDDVLKKMGLDDAQIDLKGTSTTFYSENPYKPLGHHFDAKADEIADIDLGIASPKMVDDMEAAGMAAHPKLAHIYKTRHTYEVYPDLKAFADKWEAILGREVNFVGLTNRSYPVLDPTDYIVRGLPTP